MSTLPDWDDHARSKIRHALIESGRATARLQGMKLRASLEPPTAATGSFPYPSRTCAQWRPCEPWMEGRNLTGEGK